MAGLGGGVDPLEGDLLVVPPPGEGPGALPEGEDPPRDARQGALDHEEVVVDGTELLEAAHGGDVLDGEVVLGGGVEDGLALGVLGLVGLADAVDLLVDLRPVVVTHLTGARHGVADAGRVPGTNARHLAEALVGLARQAGDAPPVDHALEAVAAGDTDDIDGLAGGKDGVDGDGLLEEPNRKLDLLLGGLATVDLNKYLNWRDFLMIYFYFIHKKKEREKK